MRDEFILLRFPCFLAVAAVGAVLAGRAREYSLSTPSVRRALPSKTRTNDAFDHRSRDSPLEMVARLVFHEDEPDAVAGELGIERGKIPAWHARSAAYPLKLLLELDLVLASAAWQIGAYSPLPGDFRREDAKVI